MRLIKLFWVVVGALGVSVPLATGAQAKTRAQMVAEAEAACQAALRMNTIEALEAYLRKYPNAPTACSAQAREALGQFAPQSLGGDRPNQTSTGSGTGSGLLGGYGR